MPIANTNLPDDFIAKIRECARTSKRRVRDLMDEAILEVLHRPLTSAEKWAIIDHIDDVPPQGNSDIAGEASW